MRIERNSGPGGVQGGTSAGKAKGKRAPSSGSSDSVHVTDSASLREKAQVMLADMDAVRMERIEEIRDALEKGTFKSDSRKVATQIVCNALAEHPWS
ncbi:negative regulator of flagellin synthesis FlgM [Mariprofundus micogutta]|uniref:Negative regulator of flagellin synthesis n=1 Tax=Mariprofundus micogutta TaxID=1921010 RepID=A0A1L8CKK2_9PROT|nr:flagellar biosynthesis anti-sigma factor FlgM [Mariprofundus micogutta]GAV19432.1 negative regulator of flagellin synthesis FlgM [Mariprofundus micogutta]